MDCLRSRSQWIRMALLWFSLATAVAVAAPIVQPKTLQLLCSENASVWVMIDADGQAVELGSHSLDCPLCLSALPPPAQVPTAAVTPAPIPHALTPGYEAHIAALVGAPMPPRGPPASQC